MKKKYTLTYVLSNGFRIYQETFEATDRAEAWKYAKILARNFLENDGVKVELTEASKAPALLA